MAISLTRNPSVRDGIREFHKNIVERTTELMMPKLLEDAPKEIKELVKERGIWGTLQVDVHDWVSVEPMIDMAKYGAAAIMEKFWMFLTPPAGKHFVTCDNPVVFSPPAEFDGIPSVPIGPFHPLSVIRYPLRKDLMFVATDLKNNRVSEFHVHEINADFVEKINYGVIRNASRYVYSSKQDETVLELVKKLRGSSAKLVAT